MERDTTRQQLRAAGIQHLDRAQLTFKRLAAGGVDCAAILRTLPHCADPDQALTDLSFWFEALATQTGQVALLPTPQMIDRYLLLAGAARPLANLICQYPQLASGLTLINELSPFWWRLPDPESQAWWQNWNAQLVADFAAINLTEEYSLEAALVPLRLTYYRHLIAIATADLAAPDALAVVDTVSAALSRLADNAFRCALRLATSIETRDPKTQTAPLSLIALGKCGARELNYCSDVDVVFLTADNATDSEIAEATKIATTLTNLLSAPAAIPALWPVDAALRPEGSRGPLVRTLSAHLTYYETWAHSWEFQALLKARYLAGDRGLAAAYLSGVEPLVWQASERPGFVEDARAMRQRVERHSGADLGSDVKLGPGGLRDVEFTVQLLQLVHGRVDKTLRQSATLEALSALAAGGYIGRPAAAQLDTCYRFARVVEHRLQLQRLRRTRKFPKNATAQRALARACAGCGLADAQALHQRWQDNVKTVRQLHQALFYRPLLPAFAQLSDAELSLSLNAANERLQMLGYLDPQRALENITALVQGVSRAAAIQRQLLPLMLAWFADGVDPDAGLARFRALSEDLAHSHWYLGFLRDSGSACHNLARVLASSRYIADGIRVWPEAVRWLDSAANAGFFPTTDALEIEVRALAERHTDPEELAVRLQGMRSREFLRAAIAAALNYVDSAAVLQYLSRVNRAIVAQMLDTVAADSQCYALIGMGSCGAGESTFASDIDVLIVTTAGLPAAQAHAEITALQRLLKLPSAYQPIRLDLDLRPEGKRGPLSRTLESYREYYEKWADNWEYQALLRAAPIAGNEALGREFVEMIAPLRYPAEFPQKRLTEVRRMKARIERERIPRGTAASEQLKLGPGGSTDCEWLAQLVQMQYAHAYPQLRVTNTAEVLRASAALGVLCESDARTILDAEALIRRVRSGIVLATGRTSGAMLDRMPSDRRQLRSLAALTGYGANGADALHEDVRAAMRRARQVVMREFYGIAE